MEWIKYFALGWHVLWKTIVRFQVICRDVYELDLLIFFNDDFEEIGWTFVMEKTEK